MARNSRKLFVNLPVRDLKASMEFFSKLGFEFNPRFTDERAACMIISEEAYAMLLTEPFFKTFIRRELCDTGRYTEGLFALSCGSRAEVDEMVRKAIAGGGKHAGDAQDQVSCTAGASTTSTGIIGKCSGWTQKPSGRQAVGKRHGALLGCAPIRRPGGHSLRPTCKEDP
jgi:uncharacterized protein